MDMFLDQSYAIDIETVSQGKRANAFVENLDVKLGNVKDPEKIKAKIAEAKAKARDRHGLSWITGKVFCVSVTSIGTGVSTSFIGFNEQLILTDLSFHFGRLTDIGVNGLWAKSGKDFDFPFLIGRYMANNLPIPQVFKNKNSLSDIDDLLTYSKSSSQRGKLSDYAYGLCIDGKTMHGSGVQTKYNEALLCNDKDQCNKIFMEIMMYCEQDTNIVADFVKRYSTTGEK